MQRWADEVEKRRGKRVAVLALARKLVGILYALWRDVTVYEPVGQARFDRAAGPTEGFWATAVQ